MDDRIRVGDKIDLEKIETRISVEPGAEPKVYVSQVLDTTEDGSYLVAMPIDKGKIIPLNVGQEFYATFYTKNGLLRCMTVATERCKKGSLYLMKIEQRSEIEKVQRRKYFRLECNIPLQYRVLDDTEIEMLEQGQVLDVDKVALEWKQGVTRNISGGGICFMTSEKEEPESILHVRFEIEDGEEPMPVYSYAVLLRSEQNKNNRMFYEHKIMFQNMNKVLREKIIRYIFNVQRKSRSLK